jgi:predicted ATPase
MTRVFRTVARQCVLVLVLDDLQWADSGTLNLLAHLGRRLVGSRMLLIGIYRPAEIGPDHPLSSTVRELQRMHGDIILDLDQAGGREFVDTFLDNAPNVFEAAFRAQLTRQTGGTRSSRRP